MQKQRRGGGTLESVRVKRGRRGPGERRREIKERKRGRGGSVWVKK